VGVSRQRPARQSVTDLHSLLPVHNQVPVSQWCSQPAAQHPPPSSCAAAVHEVQQGALQLWPAISTCNTEHKGGQQQAIFESFFSPGLWHA